MTNEILFRPRLCKVGSMWLCATIYPRVAACGPSPKEAYNIWSVRFYKAGWSLFGGRLAG